jgi:hypothetical protein
VDHLVERVGAEAKLAPPDDQARENARTNRFRTPSVCRRCANEEEARGNQGIKGKNGEVDTVARAFEGLGVPRKGTLRDLQVHAHGLGIAVRSSPVEPQSGATFLVARRVASQVCAGPFCVPKVPRFRDAAGSRPRHGYARHGGRAARSALCSDYDKGQPAMKVFVTGGAGFIGSNLVDRLMQE